MRPSTFAAASALCSITPLFPHLSPVEVVVLPTYPRAFAASADVLAALCRVLREPVPAPAFEALR